MEAAGVAEDEKETLIIEGMHCKSCARRIEGILEEKGIMASVDFEKKMARIAYDKEKINIEKIISLIEKEGYQVS